jgi:hypothetical protein
MSAPEKITLSGLPRGELEALAERLLAENGRLRQAIAELRAEVATLKGVKGRPQGEAERHGEGHRARADRKDPRCEGRKAGRLTIHEERVIAAEVPAGSRFKGYEDFLVQDLVLRPHVVRLRRERWLTPTARPSPLRCRPGSSATSGRSCAGFVLFQYHQGR